MQDFQCQRHETCTYVYYNFKDESRDNYISGEMRLFKDDSPLQIALYSKFACVEFLAKRKEAACSFDSDIFNDVAISQRLRSFVDDVYGTNILN